MDSDAKNGGMVCECLPPEASEEPRAPSEVLSSHTFDSGYLDRLRGGDEQTARHFSEYFRRMLRIKLWARFGSGLPEDLLNDVMAAAFEKIKDGEPRNPANLPAYVRGICSNLAKKSDPLAQVAEVDFETLTDRARTAEEELISRENAHSIRSVLTSLRPRDRRILIDLFYHDVARDAVCRKYKVTRKQLRLIIFRARGRFQKRWGRV